jgi:hypothetical protein
VPQLLFQAFRQCPARGSAQPPRGGAAVDGGRRPVCPGGLHPRPCTGRFGNHSGGFGHGLPGRFRRGLPGPVRSRVRREFCPGIPGRFRYVPGQRIRQHAGSNCTNHDGGGSPAVGRFTPAQAILSDRARKPLGGR